MCATDYKQPVSVVLPIDCIDINYQGLDGSARIYENEAPTLRSRDYKDPIRVAIPVLTPERAKKRQNGRRFKDNGEEMFTLTSQDRHGVAIRIDLEGGAE